MVSKSPESSQQTLTDAQLEQLNQQLSTDEQMYLLQKRKIEDWQKMSLSSIRAELESYQKANEAPATTILGKLDKEFPSQNAVQNKPTEKNEIQFMKHPLDWIKGKFGKAQDTVVEAAVSVLPDQAQEAIKKYKKGASGPVVLTTALGGVAAGEALESAEKAMSWWDKMKSDPGKFFKELFEVLFSFDWARIKGFFSSTLDSVGVNTSIIEKFAEKWLPRDLMKYAKSLFSLEGFSKMDYGTIEKVWKKYQKNPKTDIGKELGIPTAQVKDALTIFEKLFGKDAKDMIGKFVDTGGKVESLASTPITEFLKRVSG